MEIPIVQESIRVFSKKSRTFIEFRESEKSLRHELGSVQGSALLPVTLWVSGRVSVSYTGGPGFQPCNLIFAGSFKSQAY